MHAAANIQCLASYAHMPLQSSSASLAVPHMFHVTIQYSHCAAINGILQSAVLLHLHGHTVLLVCSNKQGTYEYCTVMHTSLAALAFEIYDRHAVGVLVSHTHSYCSICNHKRCHFSSPRHQKGCSECCERLTYTAAVSFSLAATTLTLSMLSASTTTAAAAAAGADSDGACDARCLWQELEQR
jgi:hypothetical protein